MTSSDPEFVRRGAPTRRMLLEALDCVLAPTVRDDLLGRALRRAGRRGLPGRLESLLTFARQDLARELEATLGDEARDAVLTSLESVVDTARRARAQSSDRNPIVVGEGKEAFSIDSLRETVPEGLVLPRVLLATHDVELLRVVSRAMGGAVLVEGVTNVIDLVDALETGREVMLVIVDGRGGGVGLGSLVTLAPDLPRDLVLVVWGAADVTRRMLDAERRTREWIHVPADRTQEQLARTCYVLLGGF